MDRRPVTIALVLAALVVGAGLALLLGSDGEAEQRATTPTAPGDPFEDTTATAPTGVGGGSTAPTTEQTSEAPAPAASPRDERAIEQAVADAAAAVEAGSPPPGIEPGDLPGTDELSIDSVRAEGDRGSATLSSGAVVQLERSDGRWRIVGVRGS